MEWRHYGGQGGVAGGWNAECESLMTWYIPGQIVTANFEGCCDFVLRHPSSKAVDPAYFESRRDACLPRIGRISELATKPGIMWAMRDGSVGDLVAGTYSQVSKTKEQGKIDALRGTHRTKATISTAYDD